MNWYKLSHNDLIAAAAIKVGDDVFSVPPPGRHHDVIRVMRQKGVTPHGGVQGFVTKSGKFVDRIDGATIALVNMQTKKLKWPPELFSEDLW